MSPPNTAAPGVVATVNRTEADAVAEVVSSLHRPLAIDLGAIARGEAAACFALPKGIELHSIKALADEFRTRPERREGTAQLQDLDSFIAYVRRFADEDSCIFADRGNGRPPRLCAVLDHHRKGAEGEPRFGVHRATYDFPLSDEWVRWTGAARNTFPQSSFAEFIEANIINVAVPENVGPNASSFASLLGVSFASPAKLMELSRGLTVRGNVKVRNAVNLSSGEAQIQFETEHLDAAGQPLAVPGAFLLALAVFRNGALYQVPARLRYRVKDGAITWSFELYRTDVVFDDAFAEACTRVRELTELEVLMGTPEA